MHNAKILVLNYPEKGRFAIIESRRPIDDQAQAEEYVSTEQWDADPDDILDESGEDTPRFDFAVEMPG